MFGLDLKFNMVTGFVLDPMHTFDIGALKSFVKKLFLKIKLNLTESKSVHIGMLSAVSLRKIDAYYLKVMKQSFIRDPSRTPRLVYFSIVSS